MRYERRERRACNTSPNSTRPPIQCLVFPTACLTTQPHSFLRRVPNQPQPIAPIPTVSAGLPALLPRSLLNHRALLKVVVGGLAASRHDRVDQIRAVNLKETLNCKMSTTRLRTQL